MVYRYRNSQGFHMDISRQATSPSVWVSTNPTGCPLPDDEIPALISALQDYMSRRAKELTRAANGA